MTARWVKEGHDRWLLLLGEEVLARIFPNEDIASFFPFRAEVRIIGTDRFEGSHGRTVQACSDWITGKLVEQHERERKDAKGRIQ